MAAWRRWGLLRAVAASAIPIAIAFAFNFTGGRSYGLQDESNAGRIDAWSAGLDMFRSQPLLGVGYGQFVEHHDHTAHNSFVLCFSELGLVGYFIWLALLVITALQLNALMRALKDSDADAGLRRWAVAIQMSFYCFLGTSLFLSRTYTVGLYILLALTVVLVTLARKTEHPIPTPAIPTWVWRTGALELASIVVVYGIVRVFHVLR
jgi:putative inorganic carbon (HCO3(-)) transporter